MDRLNRALASPARGRASAPTGAAWRRAGGLLCVLALAGALQQAGEAAAEADEAPLQAAFVLNFARFTEWPAARLAEGRFTLCQLGGSERLAQALQALEGRTVQGLPIRFRRIDSALESARCLLLFTGSLVPPPLPEGAAVLTVGAEPGFAQHGGMIGLVRDGMRLRFEVNVDALRQAGLSLSSHVLALASSLIGGAPHPAGRP